MGGARGRAPGISEGLALWEAKSLSPSRKCSKKQALLVTQGPAKGRAARPPGVQAGFLKKGLQLGVVAHARNPNNSGG